jgi:hypothetical protein
MLKSARLFFVFAAPVVFVLLITQSTLFATVNHRAQDPTLSNPETKSTAPQSAKSSKKRKKKKTRAAGVPFIVFGSPTQSSVGTPASPVVLESVNVSNPVETKSTSLNNSRVHDNVVPLATATAGQIIISEFRLRGPGATGTIAANNEFIELYNASGADHTVMASSGTGYGVAASDGVTRCSIPNGTVIPNKGHYLCVNSVGYSLGTYPAGNGTTATGDATYVTDIPDNAGIAIFNNDSEGASYSVANRLDAVGSAAEANTTYKEGTGYPTLTPFSIDYSFHRTFCPGNVPIFGTTLGCFPGSGGQPKDSNNNGADFMFEDTNGTSAGAGQRLGAPAPENLSSPIERNSSVTVDVLDSCSAASSPPNRVRDFTSVPAQNSTFGTIDIRRTVTNNSGGNITRLRFRVIDVNTFPAPGGFADLRTRTSSDVVVTVDRPPCASGTSNVTVLGTTLETPPSQPNGGAFNGSWSVGAVTLGTPLANGASIDVHVLLGIQQTGNFRLYLNVETLP